MIWIIRIAENSWHGTFSKLYLNCRQSACVYPQRAHPTNLVLPHWRSGNNGKDFRGRESVGIITRPAGHPADRTTSWKANRNRGATTTIPLHSTQCYGGREIVKNRNKLKEILRYRTPREQWVLNDMACSAPFPGKRWGTRVGKDPKRGGVLYLIRNKLYPFPKHLEEGKKPIKLKFWAYEA